MVENLKSTKVFPIKVFAGALITTVSFATTSLADVGDGYYHHDMMSWGGGWFLGPILMILLVIIVIGAVAMSLRLSGNTSGQKPIDRSIEILNERFAKGEIDEAEFQMRKDVLQK